MFSAGSGAAEVDRATLARMIAELCDALSGAGCTVEKAQLAAGAATAPPAPPALDAHLAQIQISLERIEARLVAIEAELALLLRPSWPF